MTIDEIITFLAIVDHKSISSAASNLFISQSTASSRINNLEKELGTILIYRGKGIKTISLTSEGEQFLPIVQQWLALYQDVQALKLNVQIRTLKIATNDLLNTQLLPYIYISFINKHKNIMLYTQTEHSTEAHNQVANQLVDIAIVYTQHNTPNIISLPLYQEEMVIVCHKESEYVKSRDLRDLKDSYEVRAKWSSDFETWHQQNFPYSQKAKILVGTASMINNFLIEKDDWSIVSKIVGSSICINKPDFILTEYNHLPIRTAYVITHKYPKHGAKELIELFLSELLFHLKTNPNVKLIF